MTSVTTYNLIEACREPGCPVCRLEQSYVEHYLDNQFYENVNNPDFREHLRRSLGFCKEHAWLAANERLGDALGFALIYRDVIGATLERLDKGVFFSPRKRAGWLKQIPEQVSDLVFRTVSSMTPQKRCPVCQKRDEMVALTVSTLVKELANPEVEKALWASDGICLQHLRMCLKEVQDAATCEKFLAIHREKLERLQSDLTKLIRKNDYRFAKEGLGREGDAWLRAVGIIAGGVRPKK
jgi:hypothetical protein